MSFGKMTTPIVIKSIHYTKDDDGFRVPAETIIASVHAYFEPKNATEKWTNRASLKDASALFRFRFIPGVPIDNRMVIDCLGERYSIISIENVRQKNMYYEVTGKVDDTYGKNESEDA